MALWGPGKRNWSGCVTQVPEADLVAAFKILSQDDENTGLVDVAVLKDVMAYVARCTPERALGYAHAVVHAHSNAPPCRLATSAPICSRGVTPCCPAAATTGNDACSFPVCQLRAAVVCPHGHPSRWCVRAVRPRSIGKRLDSAELEDLLHDCAPEVRK
jgi:hypothetical protein